MKKISSLDIHVFIDENKDFFTNGFIQKIYQLNGNAFLFRIYKKDMGKKNFFVDLTGSIYFDDKETPQEPSSFTMLLRKHLTNKRILNIEQVYFDRIIKLNLSDGYDLIFELFHEGNLVLIKDEKILNPLKSQKWRDRTLKKGEEYLPPRSPINVKQMTNDEFKNFVIDSEKDAVRTLVSMNLGGKYAEEVCLRVGIDKNSYFKDSEDKLDTTYDVIKEMLNCKNEGYVYSKDGENIEVSPIPMKRYSDYEFEKLESFTESLKMFFLNSEETPKKEKVQSKLERRLQTQEETLEKYLEEEKDIRKKGELIYAHFNEIKSLISELKKEIETAGWENLKSDRIKEIDPAEKCVDVTLDDGIIKLYINKSVGENADLYFKKAKKLKSKMDGIKKAMEDTKKEIVKKEKTEVKNKKQKERKRKHFWFERYRWFISSNGDIVVAGKDAKSNDSVVKKYLKEKCIYVHADLHGAPSVVVPSENENTIDEAAVFAVSFSKAWNAKFSESSAYWVKPSQVSKTPESGEYLSKGAWIIRGKRNYSHRLKLELGVGIIEYEKVKIVMCAPISALKIHSQKYIIIGPGEKKKSEIVKIIAKELDVSMDEIMSVLPPGNTIIKKSIG